MDVLNTFAEQQTKKTCPLLQPLHIMGLIYVNVLK